MPPGVPVKIKSPGASSHHREMNAISSETGKISRLVRLSASARAGFWGATALFLAGLALTSATAAVGERLAGAGMVALAVWLLRYDIARRTVRRSGLARFIAVCMLSGFAWLGVSGLLALLFGQVVGGARRARRNGTLLTSVQAAHHRSAMCSFADVQEPM